MTPEQLLINLNRNYEKPNGTCIYHIGSALLVEQLELCKKDPQAYIKFLEAVLLMRGNKPVRKGTLKS
jgi:hypothetical protein